MRKYFFAVLLMAVAGVAISLYLIPSDEEIIVLQEKDQTIREAGNVDYEAQYAAGNVSERVVVGLADTYIGQGRGQDALPILEAFVRDNPEALAARKKLAALYQAAGRDEDYLRQMEIVAQREPSEQNLKLLADMYNYVQLYDKQAETLRRLIEVSGGANPDYYVDLATVLALQERKGEAAGVIQELQARHPDYVSFKMVRLVVVNYVDSGQMEDAFREAASWSAREVNYAHIADLANILNYGGRPDLALQLMEPHRAEITQQVDLFTAYVNASINAGKTEQAYRVLSRAHQAGTLPPPLYRPYLELALARDELAVAEAIVDELRAEQFNEDEAINLIELARSKQSESLLNRLIALFNVPDYIDGKPALDAIIALARRDVDEDRKIDIALRSELTSNARIRLAQACARNGKDACFETLVARFPEFADMTPRELNEVVGLYISVGRQREIYDEVVAVAANTDSEIIELAHIKLAASMGRRDVVADWLARSGRATSTGALTELFFLANDRGHGGTASEIASVLYDRDPGMKHREYLISAWLRDGQYARALPLLRELRDTGRSHEDNYLAALTQLGRADPDYREELADYVLPRLQSAQVLGERKLQLVYTLINTGNKKAALPYINQYAKTEGGAWRTLYNQLHAVAGAGSGAPAVTPITERSRDFRVALAADAAIDDETKRMLAFSLLNDGYREDATAIFFDLAQTAGPESQEVKDLLYLWGPRLNEEQINWLMLRASGAATRGDRVRWGEYIASYGDDFALMRYVTDNPQALGHPSIRRKYFTALATNASVETFDDGMRQWVATTNDPAALKDYADIATAYGYQHAAIRALKRVEQLAPGNEAVLKDLAVLHFGRADYSEAGQYLNAFMQAHAQAAQPQVSPYEALFYQAELLRRSKNLPAAQSYYQQVADLAPRDATTLSKQSMYYTSLFHLGFHARAREGFYGLLAEYPEDKSLLADFISALIEHGFHDEARAVANQYDRSSPHYTGRLHMQAPHVTGVESYQNGRELRIRFDGAVEEEMIPAPAQEQELGWIESIEHGYDSVLIAAKPGFELRFTPTSATGVAVLAAGGGNGRNMTAQERMQRQQDLRLQLLYARMELESGQDRQALARLHQLRPHFPRDAQLLGYTANVENFTGNWPQALSLLDSAQSLTPENEDLAALRRDIEQLHAQEVKLDHTYRRIGDSDEQITTLSGRVRVTHDTEVGIRLQNDELDASQVRRSRDGAIEDFDVSRQQGELYAAHYFGNGDRLKAAFFANTDTVGAGAYYAFNNPAGRTEAIAEYQKPYWDFVEAVAEEATRSRVGARHVANLDERTTVSGEVSVNQYNIAVDNDAASTVLVRANVVRRVRDANPTVALGYGFDGEYLLDEEKRDLPNGDVYRSFPIVSREIHYPNVIVQQDFTDTTRGELVAGWAFDRLGDHGPQVEGKLTQDITDDVEAQIRASYGLETQDTDQNVTRVGGHMRYKF